MQRTGRRRMARRVTTSVVVAGALVMLEGGTALAEGKQNERYHDATFTYGGSTRTCRILVSSYVSGTYGSTLTQVLDGDPACTPRSVRALVSYTDDTGHEALADGRSNSDQVSLTFYDVGTGFTVQHEATFGACDDAEVGEVERGPASQVGHSGGRLSGQVHRAPVVR
jgi:hypothetical protein